MARGFCSTPHLRLWKAVAFHVALCSSLGQFHQSKASLVMLCDRKDELPDGVLLGRQ